jgi:hypothetical protein
MVCATQRCVTRSEVMWESEADNRHFTSTYTIHPLKWRPNFVNPICIRLEEMIAMKTGSGLWSVHGGGGVAAVALERWASIMRGAGYREQGSEKRERIDTSYV